MTRIAPEKFLDFIAFFRKENPNHVEAMKAFAAKVDPALMDDGFDGFACIDSTKTYLSHVLPGTDKRFAFRYEYDFGDSWQHKILFEGTPPVDLKAKYPLCMEGERACPPEDCGGVWGYGDFLKAIRNPKHEEHDSMLEWVGGRFDSEYFDAKEATAAMRELAE